MALAVEPQAALSLGQEFCPGGMKDLGKFLVYAGLTMAFIGVWLWSGIGTGWLGRLPGDIHYQSSKGNFSFHFPLVTCLLVSLVLTLVLWLLRSR